ncbi:acyltransferase family protein [Alistipes sp. An66]|uniref:acyltransferase family protein n=1 Tax=Alistipes sp. An66 TaxID=1965650 RepID=UPI000B395D56|nr:acyltransferase [Alistipes sp. An66]OUN58392.1 hypothetical protein B5G16_09095 [Alistipes sp. An66]
MVQQETRVNERLLDISLLRVISIVAVVAFHVYGMMYADHFPKSKDLYHQIYWTWNQCGLINIAMPMFVFISGYLFAFLMRKGKYPTFGILLKIKIKRLLLPYFAFGLIMMATTGNFHPLDLLKGDYWHLWFLPMLLGCFVISYGILGWLQKNLDVFISILVITFILRLSPLLQIVPKIFGVHNILGWYCWFLLGCFVQTNSYYIVNFLQKYKLYMLLFIIYLIVTILKPTPYGVYTWYLLVAQVSIMLVIWYFFHTLKKDYFNHLAPLISFGKYSFGIYIFHNWIALYLISRTAQKIFPLSDWAMHHTVLFPFSLFVITLFLSWGISWLFLKNKIGRILIG